MQNTGPHPGAAGRHADSVPSSAMTDHRQPPPRAVIFDLGGTLVDWPEWNQDSPRRWALSWDALTAALPDASWPSRDEYVIAMRAAELAHWDRVDAEHWSGPASGVLRDGFHRLGRHLHEAELTAALDGYARAV